MNRARLAHTSVEVTEIGLGAAPIGNLYRAVDGSSAAAALEAAWQGGIRYFDTAPHYGLGLSEYRLGAALARRPREQFVISTKVGRLLVPNRSPVGSDLLSEGFDVPDDLTRVRDYSRDGVLRSLESSLTRLAMDRVDIVYVHDPEEHMDAAITEALPALIDLREQGVVGAVGAGMNYVAPLRRLVAESDVDVIMVAGRYTLLDRSGTALLDQCAARDVSVVAAAPFNSGLLSRAWPAASARFDYGPTPRHLLDQARELARVCARHGAELPQAALQFPLRHPAVASVVVGMRSPTQVTGILDWSTEPLSLELWAALDNTRVSTVDK